MSWGPFGPAAEQRSPGAPCYIRGKIRPAVCGMCGEWKIQALSDVLRADPRFETRRKWLILKDLYFTPTGEKVVEGFRYFRCSIDELVEPLSRQDFDATAKLPFALDDEGEVDTSSVLLNLAYTASGAIAGFQAVEYRDYQPVCVTEPVLLDGAAAQGLRDKLQELDQSS